MEKATWLMRFQWWLSGEDKLQVHEAPELTGELDELTDEDMAAIFGPVLDRVIGEVNA